MAHCKRGNGLIKVNGSPLEMIEPRTLQYKLLEPVLLRGKERFAGVDIRVRVKGGGHVAQIYAIRQSISKALVAYYQKYVDEVSKKESKDTSFSVLGPCVWQTRLLISLSQGSGLSFITNILGF